MKLPQLNELALITNTLKEHFKEGLIALETGLNTQLEEVHALAQRLQPVDLDLKSRLMKLKQQYSRQSGQRQKIIRLSKRKLIAIRNQQQDKVQGAGKSKFLVTQFLARNGEIGLVDQLQSFSQALGMHSYLQEQQNKITSAILQGDPHPALKWLQYHCNEQSVQQLRTKLVVVQFLKDLKANRIQAGIKRIRKHKELSHQQVKRAMNYLVQLQPRYSQLQPQYWKKLSDSFKKCFREQMGLSGVCRLEEYLSLGIASSLTPLCGKQQSTIAQCPTCRPEVLNAMKGYLLSRKTSHAICRITNRPINQQSQAYVLPNGQVYSQQGLKLIEKNGVVKCPTTEMRFKIEEARRIFLT